MESGPKQLSLKSAVLTQLMYIVQCLVIESVICIVFTLGINNNNHLKFRVQIEVFSHPKRNIIRGLC